MIRVGDVTRALGGDVAHLVRRPARPSESPSVR